jgi:hypothetical protein
VKVDSYYIDIVRGDSLIEIQTKNFSNIKQKLKDLVKKYRVQLVYPISEIKWIIRVAESGKILSRRRSPRKGKIVDLFYELVSFPGLVNEDTFSLEVLMIEAEEVRCNDGKGSWRRRGVSIKDRRLVNVNRSVYFRCKTDFLKFLPKGRQFTNKGLAKSNMISTNLARKITYCLRKMGVIEVTGKKGRQLIFSKV